LWGLAYAGVVPTSSRDRHRDDQGASSLLGLLTVVLLLGGLAAIALTQLPSTGVGSATTTTHGTGGVTVTTGTESTTTPTSDALIAECVTDYTTVASALTDYETLKGAAPPAGTAWATSKATPGPFVQSWPQGAGRFSIRWTGTSLVVAPVRGAPSVGSSGTAAPQTGCNAL
jgi:hypothetical protein